MQIFERTKEEVVSKASKLSDFLKMEYLESCSEGTKELGILRYCYSELARLYEGRHMYSEALKYLAKLKSITDNDIEKFKICEKELEILIKSEDYDRVIAYYKDAIKSASQRGEYELRRSVIKFYRDEADKLELKRSYALLARLYEKLIPFLGDSEKIEARKKLLVFYDKLGRVRDSIELEKFINRSF